MASPFNRIKSAWNAFMGRDPTKTQYWYNGGYSTKPDRIRHFIQNDRTIINSIYNKIAVDVSLVDIKHVRLNEDGNYEEVIASSLNRVLMKEANIDQTGRSMIRDLVYSMLDEGCVALVPTDLSANPEKTESYDVLEVRVGKIIEWFPDKVKVEVYNENTSKKEQVVLGKKYVPIIENPFYSVMNEPNSTLRRLVRVLNQLDSINEQNSAGKMDVIIQLPYPIKTEARKKEAEHRRKNLEDQLTGSQYGIGYIDASEKVIQLNRSVENNLWTQAKELIEELFNQLNMNMEILNGTASDGTMQNYYSRVIEPILAAIVEEIERKWISTTAQTQGQAIRFFRDPFKLMPVSSIADIADKFTRNCIMTSNEIRSKIGLEPSKDPKADQLVNSNLNQPEGENVDQITDESKQVDLSKFKIS